MKLVLATTVTAAIGLALIPAGLAADSQTSDITVNGSVLDTCTANTPTVFSFTNASLSGATPTAGIVSFTNFANASTALFISGSKSIILEFTAMCNYAHKLGIQTVNGGMKNTSTTVVAGSAPFSDLINYTASLNWNAPVFVSGPSLSTTGTAGDKQNEDVTGAYSGTARLTINALTNPTPTRPMLQGAFTDVLKVRFGAAL